MKCQKQKKELCGYYSLAYVTSLNFGHDVEILGFNEDTLITYFIKCIRELKIDMFSFDKKRVNKTEPYIVKFKRLGINKSLFTIIR